MHAWSNGVTTHPPSQPTLQGEAVRNLTWPAWDVGKKALVFPSAPGRRLPLEDTAFSDRLHAFLNTRQVCGTTRPFNGVGACLRKSYGGRGV